MANATVQQAPIGTDVETSSPPPITPQVTQPVAPSVSPIQKALSVIGAPPNMDEAIANASRNITATESANQGSLLGKSADDIASIFAAPAEMIAHPITTAENIIPATISGLKQGVESLAIPFGGNPDNIKAQWAAHPVLQTLNLVGLGDIFGGVITAAAKGSIRTSVISEAGIAADKAVAEGSITSVQAAAVKTAVSPQLVSGVLTHLLKGKSQALVTDMIGNAFKKAGIDAGSASHLTQGLLETIGQHMNDSIALKGGQALAHPLSTVAGAVSPYFSPVAKAVFSKPAESAVSYLFGDEAIKQNPTAFAQIEESASQQLRERGIEDNVQNRVGIMSDWAKTNPDWSSLSTQGKAAHMTQFAQTTPFIRTINAETGHTFVPVKALSPENASAAISDITDLPGEMDAPVGVEKILDDLEETLGQNIGNWRKTIEQAVVNNPTKQGLIDAITSITRKGSFNFPNSEAAADAARQMEEQTGYRAGVPPKGKQINFVSENPSLDFLGKPHESGSVPSTFTNDTLNKLLTANSTWQKMLDRFGLSTQGGVGSGLDAMYGDQFGKNFGDDFGKKYASGVKIPRIVTSGATGEKIGMAAGARTVPESGMYSFLSRNLNKISPTANSVADLTKGELVNYGFTEEAASDIITTARKSMQLPIAATGVGQGFVNFLRAKLPGFNAYLNATVGLKYNSPLAAFYQARVFAKFNLLRQFATGKFMLNLGDNKIANWLAERPFVGNIIAPKVSVEDAALMNNTVWNDMHGSTMDMSTSPEVLSYLNKNDVPAAITKTQGGGILTDLAGRSQKGLLSFLNFSIRNDSVTLAKGLASQYGMTLREALGYTTNKEGQRVYNNPAVYNSILSTIESTYHYAPGFLTSPMIRNLNTVFYPLRFEAKVLQQTGAWMSRLSPVTRGELMINMSHFAAWSATPSGQAWLQKNQNIFSTALNYLLPFAEEGQTLKAALNGKFFGGDIGELGGIPFAFLISVMKELSFLPGIETGKNPNTGKDYTKSTPRKIASAATAQVAFENFFTTMLPSFPLYSILGSGAPSISNVEHEALQKAFIALTTAQVDSKSNQKMNREFKTVKEGYVR